MTGPESEPEGKKTTDLPPAASSLAGEQSDSSPVDKPSSPELQQKGEASLSSHAEVAEPELDSLPKAEAGVSEPKPESGTSGSSEAQESQKADSQSDFVEVAVGGDPESNTNTYVVDATESQKMRAVSLTLTQHHVSNLLSDVLSDEVEKPSRIEKLRFPMVFDCLLAMGLLLAVGGFTIGLFHMYLIHTASQCISEQRYKAAIKLLKGAPMPQIYARPGSDTEELLSKARYLDAMDKLESGNDIEAAIKELNEIHPGSRYFALSQEAINENTEPAPVMLKGGTETIETAPIPEQPQTPLEKALKEEEQK
jgi:hypothetical protein